MRIAVIVETFPKLSETFILNHIKGLVDAGAHVKIFSYNRPVGSEKKHSVFVEYNMMDKVKYKPSRPSTPAMYFLKGMGLLAALFMHSPGIFFRVLKRLSWNAVFEATLFKTEETFDIVHCHFGTMANELLRYRDLGFANVPMVVTFHGYDIDHVSIRNTKGYYDRLIRDGDLFIANSAYTKNRLAEIGFREDKIRIIPVALDINKFTRAATGHRGKKIRMITAGRLVEFKGIGISIQAIARLVEEGQAEIEYRIIGDGPLAQELQQWVTQRNLNQVITFLGGLSQEELLLEFSNSDIFILTGVKAADGREENQGLVIQEAQAMQLPVVVSDVGGIKEGIIDGTTGFLVLQKDIDAIVSKLKILIDDQALRLKMGMAGRKFVEENYSIEVCTGKLLKEYNQLLSRAG